jgi:LysR family positive regulator for ilvC
MDFTPFKLFITLTETLHFNRAAELSHISPSTLSRCIQQLEEQLGVPLFIRNNRSVALTPQGAQVADFARETLQQWEILRDSLQRNSNLLQGSLSLYCSVTASYSFLYDILKDFRQAHPAIELKLHTGDPALAIERVVAGHEDVAIAARQDVMPQEIHFKKIIDSPLLLIQPLDWPTDQGDSKDYWQSVPYIVSERGVARNRLDAWFRKGRIAPKIYAQVAGHEAIVSMVSLGLGVGLVPKIVLDNSPLAGKVKPHPHQPSLKPYEVGLCVLARRLKSPIVRAFWEQIAEP